MTSVWVLGVGRNSGNGGGGPEGLSPEAISVSLMSLVKSGRKFVRRSVLSSLSPMFFMLWSMVSFKSGGKRVVDDVAVGGGDADREVGSKK